MLKKEPARLEKLTAFGSALKMARNRAELTQRELAMAAGISAASLISHYESGRRFPRRAQVESLANAISFNDLDLLNELLNAAGFASAVEVGVSVNDRAIVAVARTLFSKPIMEFEAQEFFRDEVEYFSRRWATFYEIRELLKNRNWSQAKKGCERLLEQLEQERPSPVVSLLATDLLGSVYYHAGNLHQAAALFQESLAQLERLVSPERIEARECMTWWYRLAVQVQEHIGDVYRAEGEFASAETHCMRSLEAATAVGDPVSIARANRKLAAISLSRGQWLEPFRLWSEAKILLRSVDRTNSHVLYETAKTSATLGWALNLQGACAKAVRWHNEALVIWEKIDDKFEQMKTHRYLGDDYIQMGSYSDAEHEYLRGQKLAELLKSDQLSQGATSPLSPDAEMGMIYLGLARVLSAQGNWREALRSFDRSVRIHEQIKNDTRLGLTLYYRGRHQSKIHEAPYEKKARESLARALSIFIDLQNDRHILSVLESQCRLYFETSDTQTFIDKYREHDERLAIAERQHLEVFSKHRARAAVIAAQKALLRNPPDIEDAAIHYSKALEEVAQVGHIQTIYAEIMYDLNNRHNPLDLASRKSLWIHFLNAARKGGLEDKLNKQGIEFPPEPYTNSLDFASRPPTRS